MTDKVQKIREFLVGIAEADGVSTILARAIEKKILPYIDSLQEEPVSKDVEQEIEKYFANWLQGTSDEGCFNANSELVSIYDCHRIARHFANWQKQQMVKDAVEVPIEEAVPFGSCKWKLCAKLWLDKGVKGNKVKLIIIKED